ncbi:MAG TPA: endonuclease III [Candidatus Angelobacter sp.]|jgi:endonuclease-3|nr:endonuclease III [Candidatus Angelobacter sp.]
MPTPSPTRAPRGARQRALEVVERLRAEYPVAECALVHTDAFELLVATILSAQTTDERVNMVTPALFARFPDAQALAAAPLPVVEEIIRSTGFFRAKSRAIVEMAQDLVQRYGGEVPPRMEDLVTLRGVGRKTANVVLGVAFGIPGFPVDTHVTRLTQRLGLTRSDDPVRIEAEVTAMVPRQEWTELSLRLILHGRRVCLARTPRCEVCVLNDICPSAFKVGARTGSGRARPKQAGPTTAKRRTH